MITMSVGAMKLASRTSATTEAPNSRMPIERRSTAGRLSGRNFHTRNVDSVDSTAMNTKTTGHGPKRMSCAPMIGPSIGASIVTNIILAVKRVMSSPWKWSRMTARATTTPAAPLRPCRKRIAMSRSALVATAHTSEVRVNRTMPMSSGLRRPMRSESGPMNAWPMPMPTIIDVRVSWMRASGVPSAPAMSGKAGR